MEMGLTNVISAGSTMTNAVLGSGKPDSVSTFGSILRLGGSLLIVLGVLLAVVWLLRQWQRIAAKTGPLASLRLIESLSLGSKQALYLVECEGQRMLLGSSPAGLSLLSSIPQTSSSPPTPTPTPNPTANGGPSISTSFADTLIRAITRAT